MVHNESYEGIQDQYIISKLIYIMKYIHIFDI